MSSGLFYLICFAVIVGIFFIPVALSRMDSPGRLTRNQRKELADSRAMIRRLEKMALQYRQTDDTGIAQVFLDEIENSKMKELE